MRRDIRILLVGDGKCSPRLVAPEFPYPTVVENVGKSTIVTSLIKEIFIPHVGTSV